MSRQFTSLRPRGGRGQALVLAALTMLVIALCMAVSFNLGHALKERTRLQQHSDALAYSMGIVQARAFNSFASSNRAIAASYVAMNTLHAQMAAASVTVSMLGAARTNMIFIAIQEIGLGCKPKKKFKHCPCVIQAIKAASRFNKARKTYANNVKSAESKFNQAVTSLDRMVDRIHASQQLVLLQTSLAVAKGNSLGLSKLREVNAPKATELAPAVGALNALNLSCAIEGMPCPGKSTADEKTRAKVLTEVANAARPKAVASRSAFPHHLHPLFLEDLMKKIQKNKASFPLNHRGTAKTVQGASPGDLHQGQVSNNSGATIGADEHGMLVSAFRHGAMVWRYNASVFSNESGGQHTPTNAHSGDHKFEGTYARSLMTCAFGGNCFMGFRADPDPKKDFGQPAVYSYVGQPLKVGNAKAAPWELNEAGAVDVGLLGDDATLRLAAGDGAALSKALVYFHRLDDWRAPPNLFDPYWRVKLHPFKPQEAVKVLGLAGNAGAAVTAAGAQGLPL